MANQNNNNPFASNPIPPSSPYRPPAAFHPSSPNRASSPVSPYPFRPSGVPIESTYAPEFGRAHPPSDPNTARQSTLTPIPGSPSAVHHVTPYPSGVPPSGGPPGPAPAPYESGLPQGTSSYPPPSAPPPGAAPPPGVAPPYAAGAPPPGYDNTNPYYNQNPNGVTPYVGLRARMSQVWLNRWTVLILLILVRLLISTSSWHDQMQSAQSHSMQACESVEKTGSTLASMPHYASAGMNEMIATSITKAVEALTKMLSMIVEAVEAIAIFIFNMYTSLYVCLFTLVVEGAISAATELLDSASKSLNESIKKISGGLGDLLGGAGHAAQDVGNFFTGGKVKINTSPLQKKLDSVSLPPHLLDPVNKLNDSMPSFEEVQNATDSVIRLPFEEIKKLVAKVSPDYQFNSSMFPVPKKREITFCDDPNGLDSFFVHVIQVVMLVKKIFIIVLAIGAVIAAAPMVYRELRAWKSMKDRSQYVQEAERRHLSPMDVTYLVSRPFTSTMGMWLADKFKDFNERQKALVRWVVAYATTPIALFVLSLGVAGLFSCLCQFIVLQIVKGIVPDFSGLLSKFSEIIMGTVNNASEEWSNGTNSVINKTDLEINHKVFGWVNTSTHAINESLNVFMNETYKVIHKAFGHTIIAKAVEGFFHCYVGLKVEAAEKGLTWVSDHAHISFPRMPENMLASGLGNNSDVLNDPGKKVSDKITEIVDKVVNAFQKGILKEVYISLALVVAWLMLILFATIRAVWLNYHPEKGFDGDGAQYNPMPYTPMDEKKRPSSPPPSDGNPSYLKEKQDRPPSAPDDISPYDKQNRPDSTPGAIPSYYKHKHPEDVPETATRNNPSMLSSSDGIPSYYKESRRPSSVSDDIPSYYKQARRPSSASDDIPSYYKQTRPPSSASDGIPSYYRASPIPPVPPIPPLSSDSAQGGRNPPRVAFATSNYDDLPSPGQAYRNRK